MIAYLKTFWQDYQAWRRGAARVVPRRGVNGVVTRGRTHEHTAKTTPAVTLTIVHTKASDGTQTTYEVK